MGLQAHDVAASTRTSHLHKPHRFENREKTHEAIGRRVGFPLFLARLPGVLSSKPPFRVAYESISERFVQVQIITAGVCAKAEIPPHVDVLGADDLKADARPVADPKAAQGKVVD